jgi:hypothetical protein
MLGKQFGELRQLGDDVLSNAVTEIVLLRVAAEIVKGGTATEGRSRTLPISPPFLREALPPPRWSRRAQGAQ